MAETFEQFNAKFSSDGYTYRYEAWHARDAEIADLKKQLEAGRKVATAILDVKNMDEGALMSENAKLQNQIADLKKKLDAAEKLAPRWENLAKMTWVAYLPGSGLTDRGQALRDCANELLSAIGREKK